LPDLSLDPRGEMESRPREDRRHPTVVGIGASAGGLAALKQLLAAVPPDSGMAWVVVVHLSPEHESHLAELLQPHVALPVEQVTDTVELHPNRVYVIPPNANLNAIDSHLRLSELEGQPVKRATVDHFFRTLSKTHSGDAIGVVLTGTGSDGSLGLKEITRKGGLAIVQDPEEAEYDGMPRSAIATGLVDLVLPLAEIPAAVLDYARTQPDVLVPEDGEDLEGDGHRLVETILTHLRVRTARDFSRYKRSTIMRRIVRRMQIQQIQELEGYLAVLRENGKEVEALADDLLINVTSFFRDAEVFRMVEELVVPQLFEGKGPDDEVRIWSAGCATGEEAYSLAMLLLEEADRREDAPHLQIFASDLHEASIVKAREGFYPGDIKADVTPERLARFFHKQDGGYRIRSEVRDVVVFSPHNLLGDPPFSRLDLVSCRNLLIYLESDVQQQVLALFHYALNPGGFLLLGSSERAGHDLFRAEDKERAIYRRRDVPAPELRLPVFPLTRRRVAGPVGPGPQRRPARSSYGSLHQSMVERYASPSLLLTPEDQVVHLSEHAGRYLVLPGGEPTTSVAELVRPELRSELQAALQQVRYEKEPLRTRRVDIDLDGTPRSVVLDVRPSSEGDDAGYVLVLFDEGPPTAGSDGSRAVRTAAAHAGAEPAGADEAAVAEQAATSRNPERVDELEAELRVVRERLQAVIQRYEGNRQEMNAANEELQSANEELRSAMEELETGKEELQSMNEELQTVNQENRHKVEELSQLSSDLQNLLTSTDIATLFLDRQFRILRFTPRVEELFHMRPIDRGRPLSDLRHRLGYDELVDDARRVLERLVPIEREAQDEEGRWYLTKILPYRTVDDRIEGVVLTFVDITHRKQAEEAILLAKIYAESIVETLHIPILVLHPDLRVRSANPAFYEHFSVQPEDTVGCRVYELGNGQWQIPALRTLLEDILPENHAFNDFEVHHEFEGIGTRDMLLDARRLDHVQLILLGIRDITDRKRDEEALRVAKAEAEDANQVKSQLVSTMSHELRTPLNAVLGFSEILETEIAGPVNEGQKKHLARIRKSAWHLVRIIDEILTFARAEAGKDRIKPERVDLAEVTREVAEMLAATAAESAHTLEVRGADQPVPVITDAGRVAQILTNLVGNALKYSESGPVELEIVATGTGVAIHVTDHGPGIPPDQQGAVFAPFVQVDSSSTRRHGGTGLGLAIARRLARLLGGDVTLESAVGQGSTFTLRLPREAPAPPETA
jgi:two-component system, chemotaxis family, CheB/CheR fusion protein